MIVKILKNVFDKLGFEVTRTPKKELLNRNPIKAVKKSLDNKCPIIFDVGMNHGQTVEKVISIFPEFILHGFEPSLNCQESLLSKYGEYKNIIINSQGLGEREGVKLFNEYSWDPLNSFLIRSYGKSQIIKSYNVKINTIDNYCKQNEINHVDFLKTDTEGFELNVLKGGDEMITKGKITFILIELFFNENYIGQSVVGDIFNYLNTRNYQLVRFYDFSRTGFGLASRCDALFVLDKYYNK